MAWGSPACRDVPSALPRRPRVRPALALSQQSTPCPHDRRLLPYGCSLCSRRPQPPLDSRLATPTPSAAGQAERLSGRGQLSELCRSRLGAEYSQDSETARQCESHLCFDSPGGPQSRMCLHVNRESRRPKLVRGADSCPPLAESSPSGTVCSNRDTPSRSR